MVSLRGMTGRNKKVKIPARPYFGVSRRGNEKYRKWGMKWVK